METQQITIEPTKDNWELNDFLRRMHEAAQGRLPIIDNTNGLDFDLKENPEYLCEICVKYQGGQN
jgi:hypothetical protein